MTKVDAAIAIVDMLHSEYGVAFAGEEEPIFALKLVLLIESVEEETRRKERQFEASLN